MHEPTVETWTAVANTQNLRGGNNVRPVCSNMMLGHCATGARAKQKDLHLLQGRFCLRRNICGVGKRQIGPELTLVRRCRGFRSTGFGTLFLVCNSSEARRVRLDSATFTVKKGKSGEPLDLFNSWTERLLQAIP
jgi:hypothetical protein